MPFALKGAHVGCINLQHDMCPLKLGAYDRYSAVLICGRINIDLSHLRTGKLIFHTNEGSTTYV